MPTLIRLLISLAKSIAVYAVPEIIKYYSIKSAKKIVDKIRSNSNTGA